MHGRCLKPPFQNQCPLILLSPLFQPPGQDQQNGKHCHLLHQSFRITLKDTSSNISIDPIGLSSLHGFKFSHKRVYPIMVVKNIQIHGFVISRKWICMQVKKLKVDISTSPRQNSLYGPYHHLQGRDKLLILPS